MNARDFGLTQEQLRPPSTDPSSKTTELANAKRLVRMFGDEIRFASDRGIWLTWDGRVWKVNDHAGVLRRQEFANLGIYDEAANSTDKNLREELAGWAVKSESRRVVENSVWMARHAERIEIPRFGETFDTHPLLLNTESGTVNLKNGQLGPHHRLAFLTKIVPLPFDEDATCPGFAKFLEETFPSCVMRDYIQRLVGYFLTGLTGAQLWWIFYGDTATGKSTLIKIVRGLLGPYAFELPANYFLLDKNGHTDFTTANLHGIRFASAIETNDGKRLDAAKLKTLTGGDAITASLKYQNLFSFDMSAKLVLATNYRPTIPAEDNATWRRLRQIPFDVAVPEENRIEDLGDKLIRDEGPGILRWAVDGCIDYHLKGGLLEPSEIKDATREYRSSQDVMQEFLSARYVIDPDGRVKMSDLYADYSQFAKEELGWKRPWSKRKVGMELRRLGVDADDRTYFGIRPRDVFA